MSKSTKIAASLVLTVIVAVGLWAALSAPKQHLHPATTTTTKAVSVQTETLQQQAVISSLSVARAALFATTSPTTPVNRLAVVAASAPSKSIVDILDNLGQVPSSPHLLAFAWYFGPRPVVVCVLEPETRQTSPKVATCPTGVLTQKPTRP